MVVTPTAGLAVLKDREQEQGTALTQALQDCLETARTLLKLKPQRPVSVVLAPCARFVAASDAAEDIPPELAQAVCCSSGKAHRSSEKHLRLK